MKISLCMAFLVSTAVPAGAARAHDLSTSHGGLHISPDMIAANISISAFDILHYAGRSPADISHISPTEFRELAKKYATQIAEEFMIRDANGRRIGLSEIVAVGDNLHTFPQFDRNTLNAGSFEI